MPCGAGLSLPSAGFSPAPGPDAGNLSNPFLHSYLQPRERLGRIAGGMDLDAEQNEALRSDAGPGSDLAIGLESRTRP
jgi:hypothetical protein